MASKNRVSSFIVVMLVILLIIVMAGMIILGIYKIGRYPVLNDYIDSFVAQIFLKNEQPVIESIEPEKISPIRILTGSISGTQTVFSGEITRGTSLKPFISQFSESDIDISISTDFKSVTVSGMLQRLDPLYDGIDGSRSSWTYNGSYPILSRPSLFQDSIVFIDASPSLILLDVASGSVIRSLFSPCYPDGSSNAIISTITYEIESEDGLRSVDQKVSQYLVLGRNAKTYAFSFTSDEKMKDFVFSDSIVSSSFFTPPKDVEENIAQIIKNWAGLSDTPVFTETFIVPDDLSPLPIDVSSPVFMVFMLKEQGTYTLGLSDDLGNLVREHAVVCVFSENGEMIAVSVDYEADKPNVTSHFDSDTLYYAVAVSHASQNISDTYFIIKKGS